MKEIADADDACCFSHEVHSQACCGTAKHANHRIQFMAAALQVGASHGEVCAIQRNRRGKEHLILPVPEPVRSFRERRRHNDGRNRLDRGRSRRVRKWSLSEQGLTEDSTRQKSQRAKSKNLGQSLKGHKCLHLAGHLERGNLASTNRILESRQLFENQMLTFRSREHRQRLCTTLQVSASVFSASRQFSLLVNNAALHDETNISQD